MCRWVVYTGQKVLLADIIVRPRHSLVCQTHERFLPNCTTQWTMANMVSMIKRNSAVNSDGLGIGWYNPDMMEVDPEPCIFTSIAPAEHNVNLLRLSKKVQSHLIFGHVRAASPGSMVNDTNCHPFQFGRFMFMHNGCIANYLNVKRPLLSILSQCSYSYICGTTDSEVAGALFIDQLPNHDANAKHSPQDIVAAMKRTIHIITQLVHASHIPGTPFPTASSLNFAVSDGETVVATRFRDSPSEEPPSLYYCTVSKMEMIANEMEIHRDDSAPPKGIVISSEPLTYQSENWTLLPKNHLICVTKDLNFTLEHIEDAPEQQVPLWMEESELPYTLRHFLSPSDMNAFFSIPCCPERVPPVLPSLSGSTSAPASPPTRPFSPVSKNTMILESPVMSAALRALLASASPAQLREILESNLIPTCPKMQTLASSEKQSVDSAADSLRKSLSGCSLLVPATGNAETNVTDAHATSGIPSPTIQFPFLQRAVTPAVLERSRSKEIVSVCPSQTLIHTEGLESKSLEKDQNGSS